jgi:hypothetical protein
MKIFEVIDENNFNSIKEFIEINCSDILKFYKETGNMLYRGIHNFDPYLVTNVITNRKPVDTPLSIQKVTDARLKEAGFTALRSNSIFCFGDSLYCAYYGNIYLVFPFNGFSYTWSYYIKDFYEEYDTRFKKEMNNISNMSSSDFIKSFGFTNKYLKDACNTPNEILIHRKCLLLNHSVYNQLVNKMIDFYHNANNLS